MASAECCVGSDMSAGKLSPRAHAGAIRLRADMPILLRRRVVLLAALVPEGSLSSVALTRLQIYDPQAFPSPDAPSDDQGRLWAKLGRFRDRLGRFWAKFGRMWPMSREFRPYSRARIDRSRAGVGQNLRTKVGLSRPKLVEVGQVRANAGPKVGSDLVSTPSRRSSKSAIV